MHLLIRAVSLAGQPLTQAISAYFDERGGTIGRSDTNTLALPDPERRISRLQAELSRSADGWRILNVGNANPIWHNNRPVPPGEGVLLDEGDELQIGTYALRVNYSQNDETARTITKGRATIDSRTVIAGSGMEPRTDSPRVPSEGRVAATAPAPAPSLAAASPFGGAPAAVPQPAAPSPVPASAAPLSALSPAAPASPASAASQASPFADLLGDLAAGSASITPPGAGPAPSSASPFADILGFGARAPAPAPAAAPAPAVTRLPDDFDPFADLAPAPSPSGRAAQALGGWDLPRAAPAPASASPFDIPAGSPLPGDLDLLGAVQPAGGQSIDQLFGLGGATRPTTASSPDPLADFLKRTEPAAPQEAPVGAPSSTDPLALIQPRDQAGQAPRPQEAPAAATLPDHVPEINAAMALPRVSLPAPAPAFEEPPTVDFKSPLSQLVGAQGALAGDGSSPFADLGLGTPPGGSGLLGDLDLQPTPVPAAHAASPDKEDEEDDTRPGDLDMAFGLPEGKGATVSAPPIETHLVPEGASASATFTTPPPVAAPLVPDAFPDAAQAPGVVHAFGATPDAAPAHAPAHLPADAHQAQPAAGLAASGAADTDTAALWAAFCEGAGVRFNPPQGLNPDLMRVIGQVLRHAVDGSLKLVAARAATKSEMRAEVTVIQARRNNPLKFSPDTQSALEQLLQPPLRGFMTGPEAVSDAMDDLLGHTIGTMVGMRAALEGVLTRFEPSQLEDKLVGKSMLDSLLPMNRRAKLWELYLQHYETVRTEAQDDFHNLFGRAFLQAYEEQLDRLDAERRQPGQSNKAPGSTA